MTYVPTNFHRALQSHSVVLLNKRTLHVATGILLQHNERFLILTVAHFLEDVPPDELLIHLGISGQRYPMKKERVWTNKSLDLAYILLNTFEAQLFQNKLVPLVVRHTSNRNIANNTVRCALCGYPSSMANFKDDSNIVVAETLLVTTTPLTSEQWPSGIKESGKDPKVHFLLKYGPKQAGKFLNREGDPMTPIPPFGLSGAGVWVYDPSTENSTRPDYSLFGIQTGFFESEQLLVGTIIEPLFKQIQSDFGTQC